MAPKIFASLPRDQDAPIPFLPESQQGSGVFAATPDAPISSLKMPGGLPSVFATPAPGPTVTKEKTPIETQIGETEGQLRKIQDQKARPLGFAGDPSRGLAPNHPGVGGKILHTLGRIGNIAGDVVAPNTMALIHGTDLNRDFQESNLGGRLQDLTREQAQNEQTQATTDYTRQRPAIEQSKIDQKQQAIRQKIQQQAAARGQQVEFDEDGVPTFTDNNELQAYHTAAATALLHQANADRANIMSEIAQNHYVEGTPEYAEAQRKLQQIDRKISIAGMNAGLRKEELEAHAHGTIHGQELPGALHDEAGNPVGTWMGANVKPTTTARDAAARANTMTDVQGRIEAGLNDPEIQEYMGPVGGRLAEAQGKLGTLPAKVAQFQNDLVSYGAFQAGLHPVRGIGALQYFDHVMGGLHQTPEQLLGKLKSNAATAAAVQQTGEMPTTGGNKRKQTAPNGPPMPPGGTQKFTVDGKTYHIPADQVAAFKKDHPNAR